MSKELNGLEVAIIGMSGKFPGANSIEEYWNNLVNGEESISFFSRKELEEEGIEKEILNNSNYIKAKGYLQNCDQFDAAFFDISPKEAEVMDPQIRLFYECVWSALEDSGYCTDTYPGLIGLYGGASNNLQWQVVSHFSDNSKLLGTFSMNQLVNRDFMCMQISHRLNMKGPSVCMNTACSTSLVTVHMARQALLNGECDIAVAGGVTVSMPKKSGYTYQEGMVLSPDGHCRAFDECGNGTVPGDGVGVVVLKRYDEAVRDGDQIYAIIKGSAINNDGKRKSNFTAPSIEGQAEVIRTALQDAEVDCNTIKFIETHGTGTVLGDAIEVEALKSVFSKKEKQSCYLGSVKCNVGHLDAAAGIAGFMKAVLCLKYKMLPPMVNFKRVNSKLNLEDSPFCINTELVELLDETEPLRAGVSSFGIGGTNAHIILEEPERASSFSKGRDSELFLFSAKTETALAQYCSHLKQYIKAKPEIDFHDAAYTMQVGRTALPHRRFVLASDFQELYSILDTIGNENVKTSRKIFNGEVKQAQKSVVFLFPGLGNQYVDMGLGLYKTEPLFRQEIDRCFSITDRYLDFSLKEILYPQVDKEQAAEMLKRIDINQVIVFIFEYALGKYMIEIGIEPKYMVGYSMGEYTAAALAGVFSLEDILGLIIKRGEIIGKLKKGAMLSVPMTEDELMPLMTENVYLCIVNGQSCIVAGEQEAIESFEKYLKSLRYMCVRVENSHAIHTRLMEPVMVEYKMELNKLKLNPPKIPIVSSVSARWLTDEEAVSPEYWANQLTHTVRFADCIELLLQTEDAIAFLEVGPDRSLSTLLRYFVRRDSNHSIFNLIRNPQEKLEDTYYLFNRLGQMWLQGTKIDWVKLHFGEKRCRISLPGYPFERESYWLTEKSIRMLPGGQAKISDEIMKKADMKDWFYVPAWKQKVPCLNKKPDRNKTYIVFAAENVFGREVLEKLQQDENKLITVYAGETFIEEELKFSIDVQDYEQYCRLFKSIKLDNQSDITICYMWGLMNEKNGVSDLLEFVKMQKYGFFGYMYMVQAIYNCLSDYEIRIYALSQGVYQITGSEELNPFEAPLIGMSLVTPQEMPNITCYHIDFDSASLGNAGETASMVVEDMTIDYKDKIVAYRNSMRWLPFYEPVELKGDVIKPDLFKQRGVYIITGGTGRIGWMIGKYLASNFDAVVVLMQRSFPVREEWEQWLNTHSLQNPVSEKILDIQDCITAGADVEIVKADIIDLEQIERMIEKIEKKYGSINGVIHCANSMGDSFFNPIQKLTVEKCKKIFYSKIGGVLVLDKVLKDKKLDFCLMMSSTASVLGGYGFAPYAAANAFVDTFVVKRNHHSNMKWQVVNWEAWSDRKQEKFPINSSVTDLVMSEQEGTEALQRVLSAAQFQRIIHSPGDLMARWNQWVQMIKPESLFKKNKKSRKDKKQIDQGLADYERASNELQKRIKKIWEDYLGTEDISMHDNFFELGATSLTLIQMKVLLEQELKVDIPLTDLFNYTTIATLAEKITECEKTEDIMEDNQRINDLKMGRNNLLKKSNLRNYKV